MVLAEAVLGADGWGLQLFPNKAGKPGKPEESLVHIPLDEGTIWEDGLNFG